MKGREGGGQFGQLPYMKKGKNRYPPLEGKLRSQLEYVGVSSSGKLVLFWLSSDADLQKQPFVPMS